MSIKVYRFPLDRLASLETNIWTPKPYLKMYKCQIKCIWIKGSKKLQKGSLSDFKSHSTVAFRITVTVLFYPLASRSAFITWAWKHQYPSVHPHYSIKKLTSFIIESHRMLLWCFGLHALFFLRLSTDLSSCLGLGHDTIIGLCLLS